MRPEEIYLREAYAKNNKTQLIIGNGSERGDYSSCVDMQKIFNAPHQGVMLMKTFYPNSPKWSATKKISQVHPDPSVTYAWGYDYDDYHPLDIFEPSSECLQQFKEVKEIGADLHITLTMDRSLSDEILIKIFDHLKPYGLVYLRINHEANGEWFNHNTKSTYKEVGNFFVRCHHLIKKHAPNIKTVFNLTADIFVGNQTHSRVVKSLTRLGPDELGEALAIADFWSIDKYVSLNWGWPHTYPETSNNFFKGSVDTWWRLIEETYLLMISMNQGRMKPLFLHEFNSDADVVGSQGQVDAIIEVYERILSSDFPWLEGICFYQYKDYGGLGLIRQSIKEEKMTESFYAYSSVIQKLTPLIETSELTQAINDFEFSWHNSQSIRGLLVELNKKVESFTNQFEMNIYLVQTDQWILLRPNESILLTDKQFYLFIPPNIQNDLVQFSVEHLNIKKMIANSLIS